MSCKKCGFYLIGSNIAANEAFGAVRDSYESKGWQKFHDVLMVKIAPCTRLKLYILDSIDCAWAEYVLQSCYYLTTLTCTVLILTLRTVQSRERQGHVSLLIAQFIDLAIALITLSTYLSL